MTGNRLSTHRSQAHFGFTLVELLVVIGIIALLISILLPALSKARLSAQAVACQSNMHQMAIGLRTYIDANRGWVPGAGEDADSASNALLLPDQQGWASEFLWINAISRNTFGKTYDRLQLEAAAGGTPVPIDGMHHVLVCPSAPRAGASTTSSRDPISSDGYFMQFGNVNTNGTLTVEQRKTFTCYAMNYKLFGSTSAIGKISQITHSAETAVIFEKRTSIAETTVADDAYFASVGGTSKLTTSTVGRMRGDWRKFTARHSKGGYILFADGHIGFATLRSALTPGVQATDWNQPSKLIWNILGPAT